MSATDHLDPAVRDRTLASLADSLASETELLGRLADVLRDQRTGVARDDIDTVDDSVHSAHRIMHTLGEARRHRNALVHLLTDRRDISVRGLDEALGGHLTDEIRNRRRELESVARSVSAEVALNRAVLTAAIGDGNSYVRRLVAPAASAGYGPGAAAGPALINRRI